MVSTPPKRISAQFVDCGGCGGCVCEENNGKRLKLAEDIYKKFDCIEMECKKIMCGVQNQGQKCKVVETQAQLK